MTKIARGEFTVSSLYDGKTAYEVAVEGGFKGTEEEWLESLRGEDGVSITSVDVEYAQSESNSTPPTTGWGTNAPVWKDGNYIWSRTKTTYSTGNPTYSYPACITGEKGSDGRGIESIIEEFYLSTSREELLDGEWLEAPPTWLTGRYMWFRSKIIYKNPESIEYTTPNVDTAWESLDGVSLRDKTDILSGNPIYTDKADDDSVVHVEVDGKSVLQAPVGEGRNLIVRHNEQVGKGLSGRGTNPGTSTVDYPNAVTMSGTSTMVDAIPVTKGEKLTFSKSGSGYWRYHWLDKDYKFVSRNVPTGNITETVPDGVHFLWVSYPTDEEVKLERGSAATPYSPAPEDVEDNIQSVNNFDIISQKTTVNGESAIDGIEVGGRNYWIDSIYNEVDNYVVDGPYSKYMIGGLEKNKQYIIHVVDKDYSNVYTPPSGNTAIRFNNKDEAVTSISNQVFRKDSDGSFTIREVKINSSSEGELWIWVYRPKVLKDMKGVIKLEKGTIATDWTPAPEDNPYDILEKNLYKTNILLSEPLRSVGDVKDRLFRGEDGKWRVERNIGEYIADGSEIWISSPYVVNRWDTSNNPLDKPAKSESPYYGVASHYHINKDGSTTGETWGSWVRGKNIRVIETGATTAASLKASLKDLYDKGSPAKWLYELATPTIETLPDDLQTKLNNISSHSKGNSVYTLFPDKSEILTNDVLEELAPTLHARFKSTGWYRNFSISVDSKDSTQQTINQLKSNKARIDAQYKEVYDNYTMSSGLKTGLSNAKTEYNTKYSLLITHLEVLVQLPSDVKPTVAQRSNVDSAFRDYTVALQEFEAKYQEILSTVESRLSNAELKITDDAITSTVTKSTTYKNDLTGKVSTDEIISRINQTAEKISIDAKKIDLIGAVTAETMSIDSLSSITANLGTVTAGVIRSKDDGINIDLDNSTIDLSTPLTINSKPVVTQEEVDAKVDDLDAKIDQKADTDYVTEFADNIEEQLSDFVTIEGYEEEIGEINSTLGDYKEQLEAGEITRDQAIEDISTLLDRTSIIETNLGEFTQKWNFLETTITMGDEGILVGDIASDTGIRISSGQIDFIDNGIIVAEITGQHMRINRGIFVQSATIGEHKIETIAGGHTIWQWISGEED